MRSHVQNFDPMSHSKSPISVLAEIVCHMLISELHKATKGNVVRFVEDVGSQVILIWK